MQTLLQKANEEQEEQSSSNIKLKNEIEALNF